jgi:hypothetical protein
VTDVRGDMGDTSPDPHPEVTAMSPQETDPMLESGRILPRISRVGTDDDGAMHAVMHQSQHRLQNGGAYPSLGVRGVE